jgi:hypothetical protein
MSNGTVNLNLGRRCVNACGTTEALKDMFAHVEDGRAPTAQELDNAICSDCAKFRGTLGRVRIGDLAAFRPAPKPKHVREPRPSGATVVAPAPAVIPKADPRSRQASKPARALLPFAMPQPAPKPLRAPKPRHIPKPVPVGGLKKMRAAGLQKARRDLEAKLRESRMNAIESTAERLQVQAQLLEIDRKIAAL